MWWAVWRAGVCALRSKFGPSLGLRVRKQGLSGDMAGVRARPEISGTRNLDDHPSGLRGTDFALRTHQLTTHHPCLCAASARPRQLSDLLSARQFAPQSAPERSRNQPDLTPFPAPRSRQERAGPAAPQAAADRRGAASRTRGGARRASRRRSCGRPSCPLSGTGSSRSGGS